MRATPPVTEGGARVQLPSNILMGDGKLTRFIRQNNPHTLLRIRTSDSTAARFVVFRREPSMNKPLDPGSLPLLDAGRFAADAESSFTLPASWYFDPAIYRAEHEAIFYRSWIYQCHVSDVPGPGDYHVGRVADQSIFVICDREGVLHAFYNVCSHRAHPLLRGQGNASLIVCPYHQWCYQSDGCFRG